MRTSDDPGGGRVPPRSEVLLACIRSLVEHSDRVVLTDHALERMNERDISDVDVFRVLHRGHISGDAEPGRSVEDWKVKVVFRLRGAREAGVVTVVAGREKLIVLTVEWEDWR